MRKQIIFEQCDANHCLINIRNVYGQLIDHVEDKIKKQKGIWCTISKKFKVHIDKMSILVKELQSIDRGLIYVEQVPSSINEIISNFSNTGNKVKKQILIDVNITNRYDYIEDNLLKNILQKTNKLSSLKNFNKILIVCPEIKILTWISHLYKHNVKIITCSYEQIKQSLKQDYIWICSFQLIQNKAKELHNYCFETIIIDDVEFLAKKISAHEESALCFNRLLINRHFVFPILTKMNLNKLQILKPLLSLMLPIDELPWFQHRYNKKQNIVELKFVLTNCSSMREIKNNKINKVYDNVNQHFFHKVMLNVSVEGVDKMKLINKRNSQLEYKRLLENPQQAKNKGEKMYLQSVMQTLRKEKIESVCKHISFMCCNLNVKLAVIIETSEIYRFIQNYLIQHQLSYCHYEHHNNILEFNKNPTFMVCLIKTDYLLSINFQQTFNANDQTLNAQLQNYEHQQFLCLSGVRNLVFPDVDWFSMVQRKEQAIHELMRHSHSDLTRHYYVLKGTYEEKWVKSMEESILKIHLSLAIQINENQMKKNDTENDPFEFMAMNLAKIRQQYSHLQIIKGIQDIDEEFDQLEFNALQQQREKQERKLQKEEKKKIKKYQQQIIDKQMVENQQISRKQAQKNNYLRRLKSKEQKKETEGHLRKKKRLIHLNKMEKDDSSEQNYKIVVPSSRKQNRTEGKKGDDIYKSDTSKYSPKQQNFQIILSSGQQMPEQSNLEDDDKQQKLDPLKQKDTDEVEIIEVRPAKLQIPKAKSNTIKVILHPSLVR